MHHMQGRNSRVQVWGLKGHSAVPGELTLPYRTLCACRLTSAGENHDSMTELHKSQKSSRWGKERDRRQNWWQNALACGSHKKKIWRQSWAPLIFSTLWGKTDKKTNVRLDKRQTRVEKFVEEWRERKEKNRTADRPILHLFSHFAFISIERTGASRWPLPLVQYSPCSSSLISVFPMAILITAHVQLLSALGYGRYGKSESLSHQAVFSSSVVTYGLGLGGCALSMTHQLK